MKEEEGLRELNRQFTKEYLTLTEEDKAFVKKIRKRYQELLEDEMKELKRGDFVWSKEYGNGIVNGAADWVSIMFEGQDDIINSARSDLFAKGDEVEVISWWGDPKELEGIFIGTTDNPNKSGKLIIEVTQNLLEYVRDIKHKSIDKLEIILTLNGKEIDAKAISRETWDNLKCQ